MGDRHLPVFRSRLAVTLAALAVVFQPVTTASAETDFAATPPSSQWWLAEYGFVEAWNVSRGSGVMVAVIDTGIDGSHPDLAARVTAGTDFSGIGTPDGLTPVGTAAHHGTMVASLIAGQGQQTGGVWGVAPEAELLAISIGLGVPGADTDAQIAAAIRWAVAAGARIINLSLSRASTDWPQSWDEALLYAFQNDVIVVAAIGAETKGSTTASAPGVIPGVVTVAALSRDGKPVPSSPESIELDVMAPGEALLGSYPGGGSRSWGGASAAAPIVSGLLALLLSAEPQLSAAEAISILRSSAKTDAQTDFSADIGYGVIDADAALNQEWPSESLTNPLDELSRWIGLYRPAGSEATTAGASSGQTLVIPPDPGGQNGEIELSNTQFSADSPWLIPLLLALFGFSLVGSLALLSRRNATKKPEGPKDAKSARKRNSTRATERDAD